MSNFDRTRALELVAQAREDDERCAPGPWDGGNDWISMPCASPTCTKPGCDGRVYYNWVPACAPGWGWEENEAIARARNNLRAIADQLEAAVAAHDRAWADDVRLAARFSAERDAARANRRASDAECAATMADLARVTAERDAVRAEVERLRAADLTPGEVEALRFARTRLVLDSRAFDGLDAYGRALAVLDRLTARNGGGE